MEISFILNSPIISRLNNSNSRTIASPSVPKAPLHVSIVSQR